MNGVEARGTVSFKLTSIKYFHILFYQYLLHHCITGVQEVYYGNTIDVFHREPLIALF